METFKLSRNDWALFNNIKEAIKNFTATLKETNKILEKLVEKPSINEVNQAFYKIRNELKEYINKEFLK